MEAELFVMGESRGTIKIGNDSLIAALLRWDMPDAAQKLRVMQDEINEIGGPGTCGASISEEPTDATKA